MLRQYRHHYPSVHPSCYLDPSAQIIGDVKILEASSVWCNAVIRGDVHYIRIGKKTNIQDCATLHVTYKTHPLIIGNEVTVGHGAVIHGCTIKDRCLIGMGAVVLDGAVLGEESILGAGSLVTEGKTFPPRSVLMGSPARIVRTVSDQDLQYVLEGMTRYIEKGREYKMEEGHQTPPD